MTTTSRNKTTGKNVGNHPFRVYMSRIVGKLGRLGKSLLFPIATLPIAALLLRVGAQIPSGDNVSAFSNTMHAIIATSGDTIFSNLPIIFAVGIGFGLTKDGKGEAAVAALIGMLVIQSLSKTSGGDLTKHIYQDTGAFNFHTLFNPGGHKDKYDDILSNNVLTGIIAGIITSTIYNKFRGTELPDVLGFFSGRRLIPVLSVVSIMFLGIVYCIIFPWVGAGLYYFSDALGQATGNRWGNAGIMLVYGIVNRLLIPFGLHHVPNTLFWFSLGSHPATGSATTDVFGDINIFLKGAAAGNTAGTFQTGFFPVMMFGLPALAAAFWMTAEDKEQKRLVLAMFGSAALVSFLTGITEPIEFAFLFIAPSLYLMHAFLTGIFGFIVGAFGIQLGFGFSAGLFDYILSIPKSMDIISANRTGASAIMANPGWIFPIGALAATTYFFLGTFLIKKFNIATPGRGAGRLLEADESETTVATGDNKGLSPKAKALVEGFGGYENITNFTHCATRLRYDVKDMSKIDEEKLKRGGAIGVSKVSDTHIQVVIGPKVEIVNNEIVDNLPASIKAKI